MKYYTHYIDYDGFRYSIDYGTYPTLYESSYQYSRIVIWNILGHLAIL